MKLDTEAALRFAVVRTEAEMAKLRSDLKRAQDRASCAVSELENLQAEAVGLRTKVLSAENRAIKLQAALDKALHGDLAQAKVLDALFATVRRLLEDAKEVKA